MAEHARVIRIARFQPRPGKRQELIGRIESGVGRMRAAEGCFGVQVCDMREIPEFVAVVSRWASQAALDQFWASGQLNPSTVDELATAPPDIEHLVPVS